MMRTEKEKYLKEELRALAIRTRDRLNLTQKEMGKKLEMSESSYSAIETGDSMCGTLTTVLLLGLQPDAGEFVEHIRERFAELFDDELLRK